MRAEDRVQRVGLAVAVAISAALLAANAAAQPREPGEDALRFEKMAKAAYHAGRYADAVAGFEAAQDASGMAKYLYNLGRCHQKLGQLDRAIHYFERYLEDDPAAVDREEVRTLIDAMRIGLAKTHGEVKVWARPPGAAVRLDGGEGPATGTTPFSAWLPFGHYRLTVSKEGHQAAFREVDVVPDRPLGLKVTLARADGSGPAAKVDEAGSAETPEASHWPGWLPWVTLGTGAALVVGGVFFGLRAGAAVEARDDLLATPVDHTQRATREAQVAEEDGRVQSATLAANVLYIVGGTSIATGVALLLLGGGGDEASLRLALLPGGPGLAWAGRL